MTEETLLHAAKRVCRFFKIDETRGGGLISTDTVKAVDHLSKMVADEERRKPRLVEDKAP